MRTGCPLLLLLACACSGGNSLETTGAFSTLAPTTGGEGDTDSDTDTNTTQASSSGGGSTTTPSTTGVGPSTTGEETGGTSSTGPGSEASTGDPLPPQPETSWWSHCIASAECTDDLVCLLNGAGDDGVCTNFCSPAGDATSCGASPGGTAAPTCLNAGASSICALDCADGKTCPSGMLCLSDTDDDGPIEICL